MAKSAEKTPKPKKVKKPSRIKQMWQVFQMTKRYDSKITVVLLGWFIAPIVLTMGLSLLLNTGVFGGIMMVTFGVFSGILATMIVLGKRAERAAYRQIEGQPGAVGAVINSGLKRSWRGSEMPTYISPKTKDAVYRVTGHGGVVLVGEGPESRVRRLLIDEERKIKRVLPTASVHTIVVGPDEGSCPLWKLSPTLNALPKKLTKQEVAAVTNRLNSLQGAPVGIPKGMDPNRVRAQRPR